MKFPAAPGVVESGLAGVALDVVLVHHICGYYVGAVDGQLLGGLEKAFLDQHDNGASSSRALIDLSLDPCHVGESQHLERHADVPGRARAALLDERAILVPIAAGRKADDHRGAEVWV